MMSRFIRFHEDRDFEDENVDTYDDGLIEVEQSSMLKPISQDNIGYRILQKQGWSNGKGLGKSEQGRLDPLPIAIKEDIMGFGRWEMEVQHAEETTEKRRILETEKEDCVELREKYKAVQEKEKAVEEGLASLKASYYCAQCNKQYYKYHEFDNHMNSYDHAHKKRWKDLKQREFGRNFLAKWRKEDKKRDKEARRLHELAEIRAQAAELRGHNEMGIGEKFKPVAGFQAVDEASTEASSVFQFANEVTTEASTSFQAAVDSSIESPTTQNQENINLSTSNFETTDTSPEEVIADVDETSVGDLVPECAIMDSEQQSVATDTKIEIEVSQQSDQLEISVDSGHDMDKEVIENGADTKTSVDLNESTDQNDLLEHNDNVLLEEAKSEGVSKPDEEKVIEADIPIADDEESVPNDVLPDTGNEHEPEIVSSPSQQPDELQSLLKATTFFAVNDMDLPPLPESSGIIFPPPLPPLPAEESYKIPMPSSDLEQRSPIETSLDPLDNTSNPSLLNLDFDESIVDSVCDLIPKSKILLGKALARKRLKAFSQSKLSSFSSGLEPFSSKGTAALSFSLTKKINPKVQADMEAVFNDEEEEEEQQQKKEDDDVEAKSENKHDDEKSISSKSEKKRRRSGEKEKKSTKGTSDEMSDSEKYPNQPLDTYSVKPKFDFLTFVKTDLIKGDLTEDDQCEESPSSHEKKSKTVREVEHDHSKSETRRSRSKGRSEQDSHRSDKHRARDESTERERYRRHQFDRNHDRLRDRHRSDRYRSSRYRERSRDRSPGSRYRHRSRERSRDYRTSKSSHYPNEESEHENQKSSKSREGSRQEFSVTKEKMPKFSLKESVSEPSNNSNKKSPNESGRSSIFPKVSSKSEGSVQVTSGERNTENSAKSDCTKQLSEKSDSVEEPKGETPESNTEKDFIIMPLLRDTYAKNVGCDIETPDKPADVDFLLETSSKSSNEPSTNSACPTIHETLNGNKILHLEVAQAEIGLDIAHKTIKHEHNDTSPPKESNRKVSVIKMESQEDVTATNNTLTEEQPKDDNCKMSVVKMESQDDSMPENNSVTGEQSKENSSPKQGSKSKHQKSKKLDRQDVLKKALKDKTLKELLMKKRKSHKSARKALKIQLQEFMEKLLTLEEFGSSSGSSSESEETSSSSNTESGKLSKTSVSGDSVSDDQQSKDSSNLNTAIVSSSSSRSPEDKDVNLNVKPDLKIEDFNSMSKHCLSSPGHTEENYLSVTASSVCNEVSSPMPEEISDEASSSGSSSSSSKSAGKTTESSTSSESESSAADTKSEASIDQTSNSVKTETDSDSLVKVKVPSKEDRTSIAKRSQGEEFDDERKTQKKVKLEASGDTSVDAKETLARKDSEEDYDSQNASGNGQVFKIQSIITVRGGGSFQNEMVRENDEGRSKKLASSSSVLASSDSFTARSGKKTKRRHSQSPSKHRSKHRTVVRYTQSRPSIPFCCNRKCGNFVCISHKSSANSSPKIEEASETSQSDIVNMNALQALQTSYGHSSQDFKGFKEEPELSSISKNTKSSIPKGTAKITEKKKLPKHTSPVVSKHSPENSGKTAVAPENYTPLPKVKSKWDTDSESNSEMQWSPLVKDVATVGESPPGPQSAVKVKHEPSEKKEVKTTGKTDVESKSSSEKAPVSVPVADPAASSASPKMSTDAVVEAAASDSNVLASEYDEFLKLLNLEANQKVNYPPVIPQSRNSHRVSTNSDSVENLPSPSLQEVSNHELSGGEQEDKFKIDSNLEFHVGLVTTAVYPAQEVNVLMKQVGKKRIFQKAEAKDHALDYIETQNTQQINTEIFNHHIPVVIEDNNQGISNNIKTCSKVNSGLVDPQKVNHLLLNTVSNLRKVQQVKQAASESNSEVPKASLFNMQKNEKRGLCGVDSPASLLNPKVTPTPCIYNIPFPVISRDLSNTFSSPAGKITESKVKQGMVMENGQPLCNASPHVDDHLNQEIVKAQLNSVLDSHVLPESIAEVPVSQADMLVSSTSCEVSCSEVAVSDSLQTSCTFPKLLVTNQEPVNDEAFVSLASDCVSKDKKVESHPDWAVDDSLDYKHSPTCKDIRVEREASESCSYENGTSVIFSSENLITELPEFETSGDNGSNRDVSARVCDVQSSAFALSCSDSVSPVDENDSVIADVDEKPIPKNLNSSLLEHIAGRQSFSQVLASPQDRAVSSTDALDTTFRCNEVNEAISSSSNCASSEVNALELKSTIPLVSDDCGVSESDKQKHSYRFITKHHCKSEKQGNQNAAKTPSTSDSHIRKPSSGFPKAGILVSSFEKRDVEKKSVTFADGVPPLKDPNIAFMASPPPPPPPPKDRRHKVKVKHIRTAVLTSRRSSSPPPPPPPPPKTAPPPPPPPKKTKDPSSIVAHVTPEKQQPQYQLNYQPPQPGTSYATTVTVNPQHTNSQISGCTVPYAYMPPHYPIYTAPPPYAYAPPPANPASLPPPNHGPPGTMPIGSLQSPINNGPPRPPPHGIPQIPPPSHGLVRPPPQNASVYMNSPHQVPYAYAMNQPLVTPQYPPPTNVSPPAPK